ncbi:MAG: cytochrome c oxidase subunit II [Methylovirgula sp.]
MRSWRDIFAFVIIAAAIIFVAGFFAYFAMGDFTQRLARANDPSLIGLPTDWQLNFHRANTVLQVGLVHLHNLLLGVDIGICTLVGTLIIFSIWRFRQSRNPVPSPVTHNAALEVTWTVVPVLILVIIAVPSFALLYRTDHMPKTSTVLKVTGHQWYWEYQYPGYNKIDINSQILSDDQLKPDQKRDRLFLVDNYAMLPVDTNVRIEITSGDVIHSFFVSSLGLQKYAVPGRTNQIWTRIEHEGVFYGQCNQICGMNHAFMPIGIKVVSKQAFAAWLQQQQSKKSASLEHATRTAALTSLSNARFTNTRR